MVRNIGEIMRDILERAQRNPERKFERKNHEKN